MMRIMSKKKKSMIVFIGFGIVLVILSGVIWADKRLKKAEAIRHAIANPEYIDPEELLNEIDDSFSKLPEAEKQKLAGNPVIAEELIADATYEELDKSFKLLFTLPPSIRKKVIQQSAEDLRAKALKNPEKVAEFFDSPAGSGSLRGASKFFLMGLSGKEKAESAPLTQAMYEIVRRQAYKRKER